MANGAAASASRVCVLASHRVPLNHFLNDSRDRPLLRSRAPPSRFSSTVDCATNRYTWQQHEAYLLNWSSSDLVFYIAVKSAVGLCSEQTLRADWASPFSSCMSAKLPSSHRATFPPLFAQLIPFPYKERERQRAAIWGKTDENSCFPSFCDMREGRAVEICHRGNNIPL